MQNEMKTWEEALKKKGKKIKTSTAFYLVNSLQYVVSDTMHVTKLGTERKTREGQNEPAAYSHKVVTQFQLYENNSKDDESKIYETYIYIYKKKDN